MVRSFNSETVRADMKIYVEGMSGIGRTNKIWTERL